MWTLGLKRQCRQRGRVDIYETHWRMVGHQVASAFFAVLPLTSCGLLERSNIFASGLDLYGIRLPEREGVDGPADHERQDRQWQYPLTSGSPETSI